MSGGGPAPGVVDLAERLGHLPEPWSPKVVARLNDDEVTVARVHGEFVWHDHPDTDELFLLVSGELTVRYRDHEVELRPGQLHVVPRGVEHCPWSADGAEIVLIEPAGVVNTGNAGGPLTADFDDSLAGD